MASFRAQSTFVPPPNQNQNQNPIPPPPQPSSQRGGGGSGGVQVQYPPSRSQQPLQPPQPMYQNQNAHHSYGSSSHHHYGPPPPPSRPPQQQQQQQQQYPYPQPPPPPQQSYPPVPPPPLQPPAPASAPPPPPMYYPSSQYSQFNPHSVPPLPPAAAPPPPPPSSPPPPNVSIPPPPPSNPPPSHPPPPPPASSSNPPSHHSKENRNNGYASSSRGPKSSNESGWRDSGQSKHGLPPKQHKSSGAPGPSGRAPHAPNGPAGRIETEEERKLRKKREYEKQKQQEDKHRHLKESQNTALHKTQMVSSATKGHGSMAGSRMGDKRTPFLTGERVENRLKKPTTFLCKLKFRNELPDPTAQPKLLSLNTSKDLYTKYSITTLEKMHKPKLFVEPDLGIPLDLLDISVYNPPSPRPPLAPEDEELLRDAEFTTPVKQNGIRRKERPTDKGVSWLVKTQYISPLSTDQAKTSLTEKQAKELRETKGGRNILDNLNNRESQIKAIEASFEACRSRPVHATNDKLQPIEVLPLLPYFDRYDDQFVLTSFDNDPTADSEAYSKLDRSARDDLESQAIMKSFSTKGSDPDKSDKSLAYMVPSQDELWKDIYNEEEDVSYTWVREYHYDVQRGEDGVDPSHPTTYVVVFNEEAAHYLPLGPKLVLRKKRAKEGKSHEEVEPHPVPSRVTVRRRSTVAVKQDEGYTNPKEDTSNSKRGRSSNEESFRRHKVARIEEDNYSEPEEDMSE